jgi:hypothetical protein
MKTENVSKAKNPPVGIVAKARVNIKGRMMRLYVNATSSGAPSSAFQVKFNLVNI